MKHQFLTLALFPVAVATAPCAWGQTVALSPRIFAGQSGQTMLKVVPDKNSSKFGMATLIRLDAEGKEEVVWQKPTVNLPENVLISAGSNPSVVTTDSWDNEGGAHALVIYNPQGVVIADLKGEDFLPPFSQPFLNPNKPRLTIMQGNGRSWTDTADISFEPQDNPTTLVVQLFGSSPIPIVMNPQNDATAVGMLRSLGDQLRFDLKSGVVTRASRWEVRTKRLAAKPQPREVFEFSPVGSTRF